MPGLDTIGGQIGLGAATAGIGMGLGFIGQGISGLIDNAFYKRNLGLQVNAQKELIDYQNEYNDPSHQMQRLLAAGLNPNLVYGSNAPAGVSGNASAPSGSGFQGHFNTPDVTAAVMHLQQMREMKSQENLNNATAAERAANANWINKQAGRYDELIDTQISEANARIDELSSQKDLNISEAAKNEALKAQAEADSAYKYGLIDKLQYEKQNLIAQTILLGAQAQKARAEAEYYKDSSGLIRQKTKTEIQNTRYVKNLATKEGAEATLAQIEMRWQQLVRTKGNALAARNAMHAELVATANELGIKGKKGIIWTNQIMSWLNGSASTAANAGSAAYMIKGAQNMGATAGAAGGVAVPVVAP